MKVLYGASDRVGSRLQLERFLKSLDNSFTLKIAAHSNNCKDLFFDWNLDAIENFRNPNKSFVFSNKNYKILLDEIKEYKPDLIISDLNIYISVAALDLNIPLWNVSPVLFYYAISNEIKYNLNLYKRFSFLFTGNPSIKALYRNVIINADKNYIYSPLCDLEDKPQVNDNFYWVRPEYILSDTDENKYEIFNTNNKNNIYKDMIGSSKYILHQGETLYFSDAFYNLKPSLIDPKYDDLESVLNLLIMEYFNLGKNLINFDINKEDNLNLHIKVDDKVKFLNEYIREYNEQICSKRKS